MANMLPTDKKIQVIADPAHPTRHVTVLHIPPAVSPETVVREAIVQEFRNLAPV
jgi:hypothetical protein